MRVNISYSLDFESIPAEIIKFVHELQEQQEEVNNLYVRLIHDLNDEKITIAVEDIAKVRKKLLQVDTRLQDCASILTGYQQALVEPPASPQSEVQTPQKDGGEIEER